MKNTSRLGIALLLLVVTSVLIAGFLYAYSEPAIMFESESNDHATRSE